MRTRVYIVLAATVLTTNYTQAQFAFGTRAGFNFTNVSGNIDGIKMKHGLQIGIVSNYILSDAYSIQPCILFFTQGYKHNTDWVHTLPSGYEQVEIKQTVHLNYIQIPINIQKGINFTNLKLLLQSGVYFGFGLGGNSKIESTVNGIKENREVKLKMGSNEFYNALDFGLGIGTGVQFDNLQAVLGYNFGLSKLIDKNGIPDTILKKSKNCGWALTLTYLFGY